MSKTYVSYVVLQLRYILYTGASIYQYVILYCTFTFMSFSASFYRCFTRYLLCVNALISKSGSLLDLGMPVNALISKSSSLLDPGRYMFYTPPSSFTNHLLDILK